MTSRSKNVVTELDREELKKAYRFVLDSDNDDFNEGQEKQDSSTEGSIEAKGKAGMDDVKAVNPIKKPSSTRWQDRMVHRYHDHLYKTHVIADLTQIGEKSSSSTGRIGLRWRTHTEVKSGKGVDTCGNKHCPCYSCDDDPHQNLKKTVEEVILWKSKNENMQLLNQYMSLKWKVENEQGQERVERGGEEIIKRQEQEEFERLRCVPYGLGLHNYEVHFLYMEHGKKKEELVQLKLCLRCAPKLFHSRGWAMGARRARMAAEGKENQDNGEDDSNLNHVDSANTDKDDDERKHSRSSLERNEHDRDRKKYKNRKRKKQMRRDSKSHKKQRMYH